MKRLGVGMLLGFHRSQVYVTSSDEERLMSTLR